MDTKKIHLKGEKKAKGGHNNTRTALTHGAAAAVGGVIGVAIAGGEETKTPEVPEDITPQGNVEDGVNDGENATDQETAPEDTSENTGSGDGNVSEPHPTDHAETHHQTGQTGQAGQPNNSGTGGNGDTPAETTPEEIAEQIARENLVDESDIEASSLFAVDEMTTVYDGMGNELQAALVHTPNGGQFLLADADGDGIYEGVYSMDGYYITEAEGNLVYSDLETMMDSSGGYLAMTELDEVLSGDDPSRDIVDTEPGQNEETELAQRDELSEEDKIYAELIDNKSEETIASDDPDDPYDPYAHDNPDDPYADVEPEDEDETFDDGSFDDMAYMED